ncbi:MAG: hypothetical protein NTZ33_04550 [Bacteroidetes bacterium]|nr:hypothetical protein [Bacteroidota bacterium]
MKKIIIIAIWVLLAVGLVAGIIFAGIFHQKRLCKAVEINIDYGGGDPFFTKEDIYAFLILKSDSIIGKPIADINENLFESVINENPYVRESDVYTTMDGVVKINISQRKPIVRVVNSYNQDFYIDNLGVKIPINSNYPANVVIASGNIKTAYIPFIPAISAQRDDTLNLKNDSILYSVYRIAKFINKSDFLKAQIEQVFVNEDGDIELIPKLGDQIIIFGNAENMENKFNKLMIVYKEAFNKLGWDKYRLINLTFDNQVVCTKNDIKIKTINN